MNELKNTSLIGKIFGFFVFILGYILVLSLLLLGLFSFIPNQVLFYTPFLILVTAVIFSMLWQFFQKNLFETLLICFCLACMGFSFIFLAPFAVDRSLSTFIFFYSVQNKKFPENGVSSEYMYDFYVRRLNDGVNGNFLIKQGDDYYPTFRAKLYYALMYPVGIATGSLSNYQKFCAEVEKNNKDISSGEIMR